MHRAAARARLTRATLRALACAAAALACGADDAPEPAATSTPEKVAAYVGAERCARCHAAETATWQASQHAQAMPAADALLGNFDGARFEETRFERRDGRALVVAEGPDGAPHEIGRGYGCWELTEMTSPVRYEA